ncbi:MAG: CHAT domain-containing protein [Saprospiraceae bacterium]|nr:CHAT domain-containing protein [Candidatus Vicinibacter affinis]
MIQLARDYTDKGEFDIALELNRMAESIAINEFGKESVAYSDVCFNHGRILYLTNNKALFTDALRWFMDAMNVIEKLLGKENSKYALCLSNIGKLKSEFGETKEAETLYLSALEIWRSATFFDSIEYAKCAGNLAIIFVEKQEFESAEALMVEVKNIFLKLVGENNALYGNAVFSLGNLYFVRGDYLDAEAQYLKVAEIWEKALGKNHENYSAIIIQLGNLYQELGRYEVSLKYLILADSLLAMNGVENPYYVFNKMNQSVIYLTLGQYQKAEKLSLESCNLFKNAFGVSNVNYLGSLINLGNFYHCIGDIERGRKQFVEAKNIFEQVLKDTLNDFYINCINNLSILCIRNGEYLEAESLIRQILLIKRNLGLENHVSYAAFEANLAEVLMKLKKFDGAEDLLLNGLKRQSDQLGTLHPDYLRTLNLLGQLEFYKENYVKSKEYLSNSIDLAGRIYGKAHPEYFFLLAKMMNLNRELKDFNSCDSIIKESSLFNNSILMNGLQFLSERELFLYCKKFEFLYNEIYSLALDKFISGLESEFGLINQICYNNTLINNGFILYAVRQIRNWYRLQDIKSEIYERNLALTRRLSIEYAKPLHQQVIVESLETELEKSEKEMVQSFDKINLSTKRVDWKQIEKSLQSDEAAIEFVCFNYITKHQSDSLIYAAFIVKPGFHYPAFVPLLNFNKILEYTNGKENENLLGYIHQRGVYPSIVTQMEGLYDLIWKPLDTILQDVKTVYYSPSGILHRINLEAIPIDDKAILSDHYKLIRLGSTRSIAMADFTNVNSHNQVIMFGGINYNLDNSMINFDTVSHDSIVLQNHELSFSYIERGIKERAAEWRYLPGTEKEIKGISRIFKKFKFEIAKYSGDKASEEEFKNIGKYQASPRVLHIATHGFFFPDPKESLRSSISSLQKEPVFKISDHPMIRSGLIMAGGNYAWKNGKSNKEGREDGILTAFEISQMNLSNTELVVLSACETGLGDIQGNEGVYGLQRAFKIAGAKYLIMSLWQVPDKQTSLLMTTFYKKWLEEKMTIPDAFHAAQKELREIGLDPYQWAGFVLVE